MLLKRPGDCEWNPGKWDLPGGKIEAGEALDDALKREAREETGLEIDVRSLIEAVEDESNNYRLVHLIFDSGKVLGKVELSDEHNSFKWVQPGELGSFELCSYLDGMLETLGVDT